MARHRTVPATAQRNDVGLERPHRRGALAVPVDRTAVRGDAHGASRVALLAGLIVHDATGPVLR